MQFYVIYGCGAAAAREAGYKASASSRQGYRLLQIGDIKRRILDIQSGMATDRCRGVDVLLGKLEAVYLRALKDHRFYAAARAVELQARISGLASMQRGLGAAQGEVQSLAETDADERGKTPAEVREKVKPRRNRRDAPPLAIAH